MDKISSVAVSLALTVLVGGCSFVVPAPDGAGSLVQRGAALAVCYDGAYTSFCVVRAPQGTSVVGGSGMVPAAAATIGLGSTLR